MCLLCTALASCAQKVSKGTYKSAELLGTYDRFTFSGSKVTFESYISNNKVATYNGKYSIEDGQITFEFEDSKAPWSGTFSYSENKDDHTITLNGLTYTKQ